jgi:hypothetical protein
MRGAYDALSNDTKRRLRGLVEEHAFMYSRRKPGFIDFSDEENQTRPLVPQIIVRRNAGSGCMGLYLASLAGRALGMSEDVGQALPGQLKDHAARHTTPDRIGRRTQVRARKHRSPGSRVMSARDR